jgi:DNA-binding response OmpR family regulator
MKQATLQSPDLVIVDLILSDADGAKLVERLRAWSQVPIIVLSEKSEEAEKVRLLEAGADDYLVKLFGMGELLVRSHAALPRHIRGTGGAPIIKAGPLTIESPRLRRRINSPIISYQNLPKLGRPIYSFTELARTSECRRRLGGGISFGCD